MTAILSLIVWWRPYRVKIEWWRPCMARIVGLVIQQQLKPLILHFTHCLHNMLLKKLLLSVAHLARIKKAFK